MLVTPGISSRPASFADVRAANLAVVLRFVHGKAPCSRADIAAATGLNKATVSSLVAELIELRLVRETGLTEQRIGRPATMLTIDGAPYAAIGAEINIDYLGAVAIDPAGTRLLSWRRTFTGSSASPGKAVAALAALARRAVAKIVKDGRQVLGLTVGVPGLVDPTGTVLLAPNLGWRDVNLSAGLTQALGDLDIPIAVENDANLAAVAEHRYGPYAGTANLVYITGEVGIGAGIIAGGGLVRGGRGFGGELGHIPVATVAGPATSEPAASLTNAARARAYACACGRHGCLEAAAGIAALVRRAAREVGDGPITDFEPEVADIVRRASAGEPDVVDALRELGRALGRGASVITNVVNPEVVILGGYFAPLAEWLLPAARAELAARTIAPDAGGCRLAVSTLGHSAAAIGGAARVLDSVEAGDLNRLRVPG